MPEVLLAKRSMVGNRAAKLAPDDEDAIFLDKGGSLVGRRRCHRARSALIVRLRHLLGDTSEKLKLFASGKLPDVLLVDGIDVGAKLLCGIAHARSIGPRAAHVDVPVARVRGRCALRRPRAQRTVLRVAGGRR